MTHTHTSFAGDGGETVLPMTDTHCIHKINIPSSLPQKALPNWTAEKENRLERVEWVWQNSDG